MGAWVRCARRRSERGAAAVEFALVVVPLLYLVFGIISYGYMLAFRQAISQAAAEGARQAAVAPSGLSTADKVTRAQAAVSDSLSGWNIACNTANGTLTRNGTSVSGSTCTVTGPATCSASTTGAQCMTVTVDYPYRSSSLIPNLGFGVVLPSHLHYATEVQIN